LENPPSHGEVTSHVKIIIAEEYTDGLAPYHVVLVLENAAFHDFLIHRNDITHYLKSWLADQRFVSTVEVRTWED